MKNSKLKDKSPEEIARILGDAWLNIRVDEKTLWNPLGEVPSICRDDPHLYFTWLLTQPEYISFVCSEFLNIKLLPFQCVILQELWKRKFPMLIMTRGGSKSFLLGVYTILRALLLPGRQIVVAGAGFRQSKIIYEYCAQIWNNAPLLRDAVGPNNGPKGGVDAVYFYINESKATFIPVGTGETIRGLRSNDTITDEFKCVSKDTLIQTVNGLETIEDYLDKPKSLILNQEGDFEYPSVIYKTPEETDVYEVTVKGGYSFKCSHIHRVMTTKGWKKAIDLTKDDNLVLDVNNYFPNKNVSYNGIELNKDIAWLMGLLVSEGHVSRQDYFGLVNTDINLINEVQNRKILNWSFYTRVAGYDNRGFDYKESYELRSSDKNCRDALLKFGLKYSKSLDKEIPKGILSSPKDVVISFLSGLFEGDGSAFEFKSDKDTRFGIAYYSSSKKLIKMLQILLLKFNIKTNITTRDGSRFSDNENYILNVRGDSAVRLYEILDVIKWKGRFDHFKTKDKKPWIWEKNGKFIFNTSLGGKNFYLGSFDTKEEGYSAYEKYLESCRIIARVTSVEKLPEKEFLYDFTIPESHSFIGNGFIQHNSHNQEIFENVIAGFGAVSSSPQEKVMEESKKKLSKLLDIEYIEPQDKRISNQIVISGTAYYHFNHFAHYWNKWKSIVNSKGDMNKLKELFPNGIPEDLDWRDYSVIRIPYNKLPPGFMDSGNIARSKATLNSGLFNMEFAAVFSKDSDGFFKASLLEQATTNPHNKITKPSGDVYFFPRLDGDPNKTYYMGVDTASQVDNFAITILEVHPDHRRIVYCWTTNAKDFKEKRTNNETQETDFFKFCVRKIRQLMKRFNIEKISIDSQGGGRVIYEGLHDKGNLEPGEQLIWEIVDPNSKKDSDAEEGLHLIEMVNFAKQEYMSNSNHGMKKDFEDKILLFPDCSPALLASYQSLQNQFFIEMEDCINDILELKNEVTKIVVTTTANGRERFDTPEVKISGSEKGRDRKDRYSALLMANMAARTDHGINTNYSMRSLESINNQSYNRQDVDFVGAHWITSKLNGLYD